MQLETARLRLAPYSPDDTDALYALWTDPQVRQFLFDDQIITPEFAQDIIERSVTSWREHGFGQWTLREMERPAIIGFAGLFRNDDGPGIELVYGLAPSCWNRGYANEAIRAVLGFAFKKHDVAEVWSRIDRPNEPSIRVMQRLELTDITTPDDVFRTFIAERSRFSSASPIPP